MEIKINVNKKIIVNGKEYSSYKELPAGIREAYKKVTEGGSFTFQNVGIVKKNNKIIFNGKEYDNEGLMPLEERILYYDLMKTLGETLDSSKGDNIKAITTNNNIESKSMISNINPIVPDGSISKRKLIIGASILVLIILLLYVVNIIGNR